MSSEDSGDRPAAAGGPWRWRWRLLVVAVLGLGMVAFFASGWQHYLSFETLRAHRTEIMAWIEMHPLTGAAAFATLYTLVVVLVPPSGAVLTVAGGFLFGALAGTAICVVAATLGATLLFLFARFVARDLLHRYAGEAVRRMEAGFRHNAMSYMLVLRLVPLFPFWLVNLAPAFLDVPLRTFVIGTIVGIIPGTAMFAVFGAGLGGILDRNETISLQGVMTPEILASLIGLAVLSMLPVVYKRLKRRRTVPGGGQGPV